MRYIIPLSELSNNSNGVAIFEHHSKHVRILLVGNSELVRGEDVTSEADTMDVENDIDYSAADDADDQVGGFLADGFKSSLCFSFVSLIGECLGLVTPPGLCQGQQNLNDD